MALSSSCFLWRVRDHLLRDCLLAPASAESAQVRPWYLRLKHWSLWRSWSLPFPGLTWGGGAIFEAGRSKLWASEYLSRPLQGALVKEVFKCKFDWFAIIMCIPHFPWALWEDKKENPLIPDKLILETLVKKLRLSIQFFQSNNILKRLQTFSWPPQLTIKCVSKIECSWNCLTEKLRCRA